MHASEHQSVEDFQALKAKADQGGAQAQCAVGNAYYSGGKGVGIDDKKALSYWERAAAQKIGEACFQLAVIYRNGVTGIQSDPDKSRRYEEKAKTLGFLDQTQKKAKQGDAQAQYYLGRMYHFGILMDQNNKKAFEWFEKAAEQRHAGAQCNLGVMYFKGLGVPQSDKQAFAWTEKAARQGDSRAQYNLGVMYFKGQGVKQSDEQAFECYEQAARQGFADAQFRLGRMCREGQGVPQSDKQAFKWTEKAAQQGHAGAQTNLGVMYLRSQGVKQNDKQACEWYEKAAKQGQVNVQFTLGVMYVQGQGVPQSDAQVFEWCEKAARQGDVDAQTNLGWMYEKGRGVPQSDKQACEWYKKAARQGNADAQYFLGWMYGKGRGVPQSDKQACEWYEKAAQQGSAHAQCNLGVMYEYGLGVNKNLGYALYYYEQAERQGYERGKDARLELLQQHPDVVAVVPPKEQRRLALIQLEKLLSRRDSEQWASTKAQLLQLTNESANADELLDRLKEKGFIYSSLRAFRQHLETDEVFTAIRAGDVQRIAELLAKHRDYLSRAFPAGPFYGHTPLSYAVSVGQTAWVMDLLSKLDDEEIPEALSRTYRVLNDQTLLESAKAKQHHDLAWLLQGNRASRVPSSYGHHESLGDDVPPLNEPDEDEPQESKKTQPQYPASSAEASSEADSQSSDARPIALSRHPSSILKDKDIEQGVAYLTKKHCREHIAHYVWENPHLAAEANRLKYPASGVAAAETKEEQERKEDHREIIMSTTKQDAGKAKEPTFITQQVASLSETKAEEKAVALSPVEMPLTHHKQLTTQLTSLDNVIKTLQQKLHTLEQAQRQATQKERETKEAEEEAIQATLHARLDEQSQQLSRQQQALNEQSQRVNAQQRTIHDQTQKTQRVLQNLQHEQARLRYFQRLAQYPNDVRKALGKTNGRMKQAAVLQQAFTTFFTLFKYTLIACKLQRVGGNKPATARQVYGEKTREQAIDAAIDIGCDALPIPGAKLAAYVFKAIAHASVALADRYLKQSAAHHRERDPMGDLAFTDQGIEYLSAVVGVQWLMRYAGQLNCLDISGAASAADTAVRFMMKALESYPKEALVALEQSRSIEELAHHLLNGLYFFHEKEGHFSCKTIPRSEWGQQQTPVNPAEDQQWTNQLFIHAGIQTKDRQGNWVYYACPSASQAQQKLPAATQPQRYGYCFMSRKNGMNILIKRLGLKKRAGPVVGGYWQQSVPRLITLLQEDLPTPPYDVTLPPSRSVSLASHPSGFHRTSRSHSQTSTSQASAQGAFFEKPLPLSTEQPGEDKSIKKCCLIM
jgi:uncharacterized protein